MSGKLPAYAVEVSGYVLPKPVGGHPALDFCNTWAGWDAPPLPGSEWLRGYGHLAAWAGYAGLLDEAAAAELRGGDHPAVLRRARRFRAALYRVLRHGDDDAFDAVATEVTAANGVTRFVEGMKGTTGTAGMTGTAGARFVLADPTAPLAPLRAAALSAAELLAGPLRARVAACPGDGCGWLFVNRGGRTWCTMATCGNRAKVRAHAARHAF